jgi:hypothetical protein
MRKANWVFYRIGRVGLACRPPIRKFAIGTAAIATSVDNCEVRLP